MRRCDSAAREVRLAAWTGSMTKILIVDEAELFLKLERSFLQRAGFDLLLASTPHELLRKARLSRPDLVLLHSAAHGGECGIPCARRLKENPETSGIPVILILPREAGRDGPSPPCERILDSPVDSRALIEAISGLAGVSRRAHPRVLAELPMEVRSGSGARRGRTRDVSAGGLFIVTRRPLETGDPVRVKLTLPSPGGTRVLWARGVVVRRVTEDPSSYRIAGNAVRLADLDESGRRALDEFVGQRGAAP